MTVSKMEITPLSLERTPLICRDKSHSQPKTSEVMCSKQLRTAIRRFAPSSTLKSLINLSSIRERSALGETALHTAARCGNTLAAERLIEANADIHERSNTGIDALAIASAKGHSSIVQLLLDNNAHSSHCDNQGRTPLLAAVSHNQCDVVDLLLKNGADIDSTQFRLTTPLMAAAYHNCLKTLKKLIKEGADINVSSASPRHQKMFGNITALHIAHWASNHEAVKILLIAHLEEYINMLEQHNLDNAPLVQQHNSSLFRMANFFRIQPITVTDRINTALALLNNLQNCGPLENVVSTRYTHKWDTQLSTFFKLANQHGLLNDIKLVNSMIG